MSEPELLARLSRYAWYVPETDIEIIAMDSAFQQGLVVRRLRLGFIPPYEYRLPDFDE